MSSFWRSPPHTKCSSFPPWDLPSFCCNPAGALLARQSVGQGDLKTSFWQPKPWCQTDQNHLRLLCGTPKSTWKKTPARAVTTKTPANEKRSTACLISHFSNSWVWRLNSAYAGSMGGTHSNSTKPLWGWSQKNIAPSPQPTCLCTQQVSRTHKLCFIRKDTNVSVRKDWGSGRHTQTVFQGIAPRDLCLNENFIRLFIKSLLCFAFFKK